MQDPGRNFRRHLNDPVPNAAVTYNFSPAHNLRLAYQMRISRPSIEQLSPYKMTIGTEVRTGNPNLDSERYNSLSLTYTNFGRILGGNIQLIGTQSSNTIEDLIYYVDNMQYNTYGNVGKNRRVKLNGFLNINISQAMQLGLNAELYYTHIKSPSLGLSNHGWNGSYGANWSYRGPWSIRYSAYGGQSTGDIMLQGKWCGYYYYGLSISRSFLKNDALTVAVNANNFFTKYNHFKMKSWADGRYETNNNWSRNWNVGVSISWNFGQLAERVKDTGADMQNDDVKASGNNRGGGSGTGGISL